MPAPTPDQMIELALAYFAEAGVPVTVGDDGLATEDGRVFGLEPLRRRLRSCEPSAWAEAVAHHFRLLAEVDPSLPDTFSAARPNLRSAVVAEADLGLFDGAIVERKMVDGLGERLMLRRGELAMTVNQEAVDRWDVAAGALWKVARDNTLLDEPVEAAATANGYVVLRGGRWTSTHVLAIEKQVRDAGFGALVAVPARDEVLLHAIVDEGFVEVALAMITHAASTYAAAPLPVGCDLHWWGEGKLWRICTPASDGYRYLRVPEFSAALWRLEDAKAAGRCRRTRPRS